ncbi:MAG TPA: outer membrane protein assembly factor BamD [Pyrinomonadaceae bacterium]|nr:outer membrane protein assembly factor BamD [Pyrinomonadaceae bacterium]
MKPSSRGESSGRVAPALCALLAALAASAGVAWGCGWNGFENSVRFGGGGTDYERSRLPPLPAGARGEKKSAAEDEDGVTAKQRAAEIDDLWKDACGAVDRGEFEKAGKFLRHYAERTSDFVWGTQDWDQPTDWPDRRNSAFDQLDALAALGRGSKPGDVSRYLAARRAYDDWLAATTVNAEDRVYWPADKAAESKEKIARKEAERAAGMREWADKVEPALGGLASDPNLSDNAAYLRAVGIYRAGQPGDAAAAFEEVAARYPRGEKREAALYMAGRVWMESSAAYLGGETATSESPCGADCRDEGWTGARRNFARLLADYPRGRYSPDARGWLAYLDYRAGDTAGALVEYYRLLGGEDAGGRELAAASLRLVRARADDADMDRVEAALEREPRAALAYAYHNIYNYAPGYYLRVPKAADENPYESSTDYSEKYEWQEHREATLRERAETKELRRAADFAARLMRRYPRAEVGGAFAVRLACAQFELGDARRALETARRALSSGLVADERAQGLWVEGVAEYRLKDYATARATLSRLVAEFPAGGLARGAREMLATVEEDAGDLAGALEQYLALGYDPDVAYFLDVLMTPEQLASFVSKHPDSPRRDELLYALGLRYLRAGRYTEARAALSRVHTNTDSYELSSSEYSGYYSRRGIHGDTDGNVGPGHPKLNFRHTFWDEDGDGDTEYLSKSDADARSLARDSRVYADWLLRDMKTTDDLERLQSEVDRPAASEAKAEAMYQLASYFYEGELLFYNPAAWRGMRAEMIRSLDETNYRSPDEAETLWRYEQEQEGPARALTLYLEIVRRFPQTRAARDALYTAILCHQRLSNFNGYWRGVYEKGMHAGQRLVTLADLRRAYPDYRLPSVGRWEPSTRTVGGEPAWPAPPKPKELTRTARARLEIKRAERRVGRAWELFGEVYGGRMRRWTLAALRWTVTALAACLVLLVFRRTRRARRFLYRQLARCRTRARTGRGHNVYAPKSSYAAHLRHTWGGALRGSAGEAAHKLLRLTTHERGRAALALNLFTHALLTILLWAVLWAAKA